MVKKLSCSSAHGIFSDQQSNPCLPHWQADSLPPTHQGSLQGGFLITRPPWKSLEEGISFIFLFFGEVFLEALSFLGEMLAGLNVSAPLGYPPPAAK